MGSPRCPQSAEMGLGRAPALRSLQPPHLGSQRSDLPGESNLAWKPLKEKGDIQRAGGGAPKPPFGSAELWQHPPKPGAWPTAPTQAQHLRAVLAARGPATRRDTVSQNLLPPQTRQQPCSVWGALGGVRALSPLRSSPVCGCWRQERAHHARCPGGHADTHGEPRWPWESGLALPGQKGRFEGLAHPAKPCCCYGNC